MSQALPLLLNGRTLTTTLILPPPPGAMVAQSFGEPDRLPQNAARKVGLAPGNYPCFGTDGLSRKGLRKARHSQGMTISAHPSRSSICAVRIGHAGWRGRQRRRWSRSFGGHGVEERRWTDAGDRKAICLLKGKWDVPLWQSTSVSVSLALSA